MGYWLISKEVNYSISVCSYVSMCAIIRHDVHRETWQKMGFPMRLQELLMPNNYHSAKAILAELLTSDRTFRSDKCDALPKQYKLWDYAF